MDVTEMIWSEMGRNFSVSTHGGVYPPSDGRPILGRFAGNLGARAGNRPRAPVKSPALGFRPLFWSAALIFSACG